MSHPPIVEIIPIISSRSLGELGERELATTGFSCCQCSFFTCFAKISGDNDFFIWKTFTQRCSCFYQIAGTKPDYGMEVMTLK
jgi:hypothetical protein